MMRTTGLVVLAVLLVAPLASAAPEVLIIDPSNDAEPAWCAESRPDPLTNALKAIEMWEGRCFKQPPSQATVVSPDILIVMVDSTVGGIRLDATIDGLETFVGTTVLLESEVEGESVSLGGFGTLTADLTLTVGADYCRSTIEDVRNGTIDESGCAWSMSGDVVSVEVPVGAGQSREGASLVVAGKVIQNPDYTPGIGAAGGVKLNLGALDDAATTAVVTQGVGVTQPQDSDNDGLRDTWEVQHFGGTASQDGSGDPDQDGLNNTQELAMGTDPNEADSDGDGISDGDEIALGTHPAQADSDGDGVGDGVDNCPTEPNPSQENQDGDAYGDVCDGDRDGDGINDVDEMATWGDLETADSSSDGDGDGYSDRLEVNQGSDPTDAQSTPAGEPSGGGGASEADSIPEHLQRWFAGLTFARIIVSLMSITGGLMLLAHARQQKRNRVAAFTGGIVTVCFGVLVLLGTIQWQIWRMML